MKAPQRSKAGTKAPAPAQARKAAAAPKAKARASKRAPGPSKPVAKGATPPAAKTAVKAPAKAPPAAVKAKAPPVAVKAKVAPASKATPGTKPPLVAPKRAAASAAPLSVPSKLSSKGASGKPVAHKPSAKAAPLPPPPAARPKRKSVKEAAGVSTEAVARRTGKSWDDWFEVLDSAGAATLDQRGVVAILAQKHGIGPWWQQMIAVGYEAVRGKSDKPAAPDGLSISSSCTLDAPLAKVFKSWNDSGERARWLADDRFVVRSYTAGKVIQARWGKGTSQVAVSFLEKSGRTEVSVQHHQIESAGAAAQMKAYWAKKLALLEQALAPRQ